MRTSIFLNPLVIFATVWMASAALFALHLSRLLIPSKTDAVLVSIFLILFFAMGCIASRIFPRFQILRSRGPIAAKRSLAVIAIGFFAWSVASAYEVIVMGGVPLMWKILGDPRGYMDFGIGTLHGFLNALLSALAIYSWVVYLVSGQRIFLLVPLWALTWSLIVMSRQLTLSIGAELILLWMLLNRVSFTAIIIVVLIGLVGVLGFGMLGDIRNGVGHIYLVSEINRDDVLTYWPSGFTWVYMYATTPLANLLNIAQNHAPANDPLWSQTMQNLLPSILRFQVVDDSLVTRYWITPAFNVSTAFANPFLDWGYDGVFAVAAIWGAIAGYLHRRAQDSALCLLCYAVVAQCTLYSIFFNFLFALPVIAQLPLLLMIIWFAGGNAYPGNNPPGAAPMTETESPPLP